MQAFPGKSEFCEYAKVHNLIPVYTEVSTDMDTPVSIYYKLVGDSHGYILESADSSRHFGRYSFIGTDPLAIATAYAGGIEIQSGGAAKFIAGKPVEAFKQYLGSFSAPVLADLPQLSGGAVGYFAYEAVGTWERVRGLKLPATAVLAEFMLCRVLLIIDHLTHTTKLACLVKITDQDRAAELYQTALDQLAQLLERLKQPVQPEPNVRFDEAAVGRAPNVGQFEDGFVAKVRKAKEYIAAGDIFQVVLSQQFRRRLTKQPFALYRRLRQINPSPYMFYINFGRRKLAGASPEMLVKLNQDKVVTYPIAGTRPRGRSAEEDRALAVDLLNDEKEKAEHAMLVDLGRNDIGRISRPGTVEVSRLMEIEKFSHVMHIVSEVTGCVDPKYTALDALQACFPAGTLSGAPKVRAMEIIDELEEEPRGPYAGAVGYIDFCGNMDTCITIRTIFIDGAEAITQTGAGIVADSVPEKEYQEVLQKAQVLFQVLDEEGNHDSADR
ncbi:anthranilate synthase component I family protein|uniref:Anthranilate synthase component 1 n=1 Tax=Dendrosporobacter quercicolus TaxID=146817 RepID=A0A1G9VYL8_9FIRM|nr:anthranilate synthase component I family protein [Dendrosporobacter quercicolus]NSL47765.1 anthranilate synthase component I family protein [Dendrosporobacter quercicolus DSM 1736]SDM77354.1 anthranilate synthase component 1 [Dendrosporobacter quercicolus]